MQEGAPEELAHRAAALQHLTTVSDLVDLATASSWPLAEAARLYHQVGAAFAFDRLRAAAGGFRGGDPFERLAVRRLIEDMLAEQAALTGAVLKFAGNAQAAQDEGAAKQAVASWAALHPGPARSVKTTVEEIEAAGGGWTFAKLTIANAALRELTAAAAKG